MNSKFAGYLFEVAWILPSITIPITFLVAIVLTAFAVGIGVPGNAGRINPADIDKSAMFSKRGVREVSPGNYEAAIVVSRFLFDVNKIEVPVGSKVTFNLTSRDVIHGMLLQRTPINVMVVPGQISRVSARFDQPGEYLFVCHEYCGAGHHVMYGKVIVK